MPSSTAKATPSTPTAANSNVNIRQQIISKTPRVKRKKSNTKQKDIIETTNGMILPPFL